VSKKSRKIYGREFRLEAVRLITEKGFSIPDASRNLGIDYNVLRCWKKQLANDPVTAFPGKGRQEAADEQLNKLQLELDLLKKPLTSFAEDQK
jgi:transposase